MATTIPGVDYAWSKPGGAALKAAGKLFACRYLSHDPAKNLTLPEATDLATHGVWSVVVWETTKDRAGAGRSAGSADAHDAVAQATAAGMPSGRPLYFAVDYDAVPSTVAAYFQGVASVLGAPRTRIYGGYKVVKYLLDNHLVSGAWQTAAWSAGKRDARAAIYQDATTVRINGVTCDNNQATAADYGQWMPGKPPTPEGNVATLDADDKKYLEGLFAKTPGAVWNYPLISPTAAAGTDPHRPAGTFLRYDDARHADLVKRLAAQEATITALVALAGQDVDTAQVVAAVQQAIAAAVVHVDVNVTGQPTTP